jgi:hypothetical protein
MLTLSCMNINQTIIAVAFVILSGFGTLAAFGLRYVPIGGDGYNNPVLVWDRWTQEVCQITFTDQPRYCSQVRLK